MREREGTTDTIFIETTCLGTTSFEEAVDQGTRKFVDAQAQGKAWLLSIKQARERGILPFPYRVPAR